MFGRGKRKPADDDEPLVPHGLIWHATFSPGPTLVPKPEAPPPSEIANLSRSEAPPPEEKESKKELFGTSVQYAHVLEMTRRARRNRVKASEETAPEPAGSSAPTPWWRTARSPSDQAPPIPIIPLQPLTTSAQEITDGVAAPDVPAETTTAPVLTSAPVEMPSGSGPTRIDPPKLITTAAPEPIQAVATPHLADVKRTGETASRKKPVIAFSPLFSRLRHEEKKLRSAAIAFTEKALDRSAHALRNVEFRARCTRLAQGGQVLMRGGSARSREFALNSLTVAKTFWNTSVARARDLSQKQQTLPENEAIENRTTAGAASEVNRFTLAQLGSRLAKLRVRARILFAQQLSKWEMRRHTPSDIRLWSSMAMAAVAAVLALAIMSLVPHYAARSLPSRVLATSSAAKGKSANAEAAKASEKDIKTRANRPQRSASIKKAPRPKPRQTENDDYVAPDTYKYYGNKSQASR